MLYHAAQGGAFDLKTAVIESLESLQRAGEFLLHQQQSLTSHARCSHPVPPLGLFLFFVLLSRCHHSDHLLHSSAASVASLLNGVHLLPNSLPLTPNNTPLHANGKYQGE